ncbi:PREDICTED: tumor necrosis factor receptor superfamily member 9 [Myotis davidii]|uniref:tumor necrosis factor receptor superfamily member 9 n=1 Tax=Myotis davidii TaxID=225400 RepID=UPI0007672DAA|nr:PREDICTED: tumor necrosis factor receptor superfamily member 9 [Myotis davidii]
MGSGRYGLLAAVLLVVSVERVRPGQGSCRDCPAGTFCGKTKTPTCIPCPSDSFSRSPGQEACNLCRRCEGCKDCDPGTFNDQKLGACRPWTDCARAGKAVLVNGTKERDVVCGPHSGDPKLLSILKQPFLKPVRTAQEEDGCSCGFPEEEEGEEGAL